jgi:flagellin-like protein
LQSILGKKAEMGIGTLILFIAMILVAAIAASVLIQTATSLQNKALLTGDRTARQISGGFQALIIYGTDDGDGLVDEFVMKAKLMPGSEPISLNSTMIEVLTNNMSLDLKYGGSDCSLATGNRTHYFAQTLIVSPTHQNSYVVNGEVVMLCFSTPYGMDADEDVSFLITPKSAYPLEIETALPDKINTGRIFIYP